MIASDSQPWRDHAECRGSGTDKFFPERGEMTTAAKAVCHGCTVRDECLEYALATGEKFGIWGGLSERERRRVRRQRRLGPRLSLGVPADGRVTS